MALFAVAAFVLLCATANERTFGTITDENQVLYTAFSMAESGEIGIGRGQLFSVNRTEGDAVSPYGMGLSFLEFPVAALAGPWEMRFGAGSSQTLFVGLQILLVAAAAAGAGFLALVLGAGRAGIGIAILGTAFGSPLWAYPAAGYSEPLQALLLVLAIFCAVRASRNETLSLFRVNLWAAAAGFCAGYAVLTKGVNLVLVPFVLAPLFLDRRIGASFGVRLRLVLASAAGAGTPLALWLLFEVVRFGRPFASYAGLGFTHPFGDGLWRLLFGLNKGLLLYFPLLIVSMAGVAVLLRQARIGAAVAITSPFVLNLLVASSWWAWDGTMGWGPRLLVPALPALAAAAAIGSARSAGWRWGAIAVVALGAGVNLLGALQSESSALTYVSLLGSTPLSSSEAARYAPYFLEKGPKGEARLPLCYAVASDRAFAPIRLHAFLLRSRCGAKSADEVMERLASPPWLSAHPALIPDFHAPTPALQNRILAAPFTWPHLGAALRASPSERAESFNPAYDNALSDQIARRFDLGHPELALELSRRLHSLRPSGYTAALHAEALRLCRRYEELEVFLQSLPPASRRSTFVGFVQALSLRDLGNESAARSTFGALAQATQSELLIRYATGPLSLWPRDLRALMAALYAPRMMEAPGMERQ